MHYKEMADILFPNLLHSAEYYINKYKPRQLAPNGVVTRFAPSPTGFMHIGNFFQAFISFNLAKNTNGILFLRIEDTYEKRKIKE